MNFTKSTPSLSLRFIAAALLSFCLLQPALAWQRKHHKQQAPSSQGPVERSSDSNATAGDQNPPTKSSTPPFIEKDLKDSDFGEFQFGQAAEFKYRVAVTA